MKHLDELYTPDGLRGIANFLKQAALAEPGTLKRHVFVNGMRARVEFDSERSEFHTYLGCSLRHPENADLLAWGAALGAVDAEMVSSRDFTDNGVIFYNPGFKWLDVPAAPVARAASATEPVVQTLSHPAPTAARQKQFA